MSTRSRNETTSSAPFWRRVAAPLVAMLYLVTLGLPSLHLVLEKHEVCAEHGELAHVDVPTTSALVHVTDGIAIDASPTEEAHGHCQVPQVSSAVVSPSHALLVDALLSPEARDQQEPLFVLRSVRALTFAPKTSPPSC
jgi:hypothetical protein